jgi:hypothetical protein
MMEVREPEQQAMMEMTTKAQRVDSVLISKLKFIAKADPETLKMQCRKSLKSSLQEERSAGTNGRYGRG